MTTKKQKQIPPLRCGMTTKKQRQRPKSKGKSKGKGKGKSKSKRKGKGKGKGKTKENADSSATLRNDNKKGKKQRQKRQRRKAKARAEERLLVAYDRKGADSSGTEGRDKAGQEGYDDKKSGYCDEGEGVAGAYAVDHALDQTAERVGCDESDDDTDCRRLNGLSDDELHDVAARCSKGDA